MTLLIESKDKSYPLSEHFELAEFRCKCFYPECNVTKVDTDLIALLEDIHRFLDEAIGHVFPIKVKSGYRCVRHNDETPGAAKDSQHPEGKAADIIIPNKYHRMISMLVGDRGGVGYYDDRLHIDVRGSRARWGKEP